MSAERYDPVGKVVRIGLAAALALLALQSVVALIASLDFHSYHSLFDLDRNNGIPDVVSTGTILAAAVGAFLVAVFDRRARVRGAALSLLLVIVAIEDILQVEVTGGTAAGAFVIATLVVTAALIITVAWSSVPRIGLALVVALTLLVAAVEGASAYDGFAEVLGSGYQGRGDVEYELGIVVKQGLELVGWSLVAIGLWATAFAARARL